MDYLFPKRTQSRFYKVRIVLLLTAMLCALWGGLKYIGTYYTRQILENEIQSSGMRPLIHYKDVSFDPFTLTPTIYQLSLGDERYPWLRFDKVTLHYFPLIYPKLNIAFSFAHDASKPLSRDTRYLLYLAGLKQLDGSGRFVSSPSGQNLVSTLTLKIKQAGKLRLSSNLDILSKDFSLHELRSDILASMAMGQLEAIPILYGDSLAARSLSIDFDNQGMIQYLWPHFSQLTPSTQQAYLDGLIDKLGLAAYQTPQAIEIRTKLADYLKNPQKITIKMSPEKATKLGDLMKYVEDKSLSSKTHMTIYTMQQIQQD